MAMNFVLKACMPEYPEGHATLNQRWETSSRVYPWPKRKHIKVKIRSEPAILFHKKCVTETQEEDQGNTFMKGISTSEWQNIFRNREDVGAHKADNHQKASPKWKHSSKCSIWWFICHYLDTVQIFKLMATWNGESGTSLGIDLFAKEIFDNAGCWTICLRSKRFLHTSLNKHEGSHCTMQKTRKWSAVYSMS